MVCVLLGFFITFVCEKQSPYRPSVVYRLTPVFKWQIVVWCNFLIEYDKKTISIFLLVGLVLFLWHAGSVAMTGRKKSYRRILRQKRIFKEYGLMMTETTSLSE